MINYFIQIPEKIAKRKDLNSTAKLVFGAIHTMLNTTGKFFMSNAQLGKMLGLSGTSAENAVSKLSQCKLIISKLVHDNKHPKRVKGRMIYLAPQQNNVHPSQNSVGGIQNNVEGAQNNVCNKLPNKSSNKLKRYTSAPENSDELYKFVSDHWGTTYPKALRFINIWLKNGFTDKEIKNAMTITFHNDVTIYGMPSYTNKVLKSNEKKKSSNRRGDDKDGDKFKQEWKNI